jgi:hypothetical protein
LAFAPGRALGRVGHTTFPDDFREYEGCRSDDPKFHAYIEIRVMIEAAGTVAHNLKSPARAHDSSDECHHWPWVEAVARALVEKKELCGSDVSDLRALTGA